MNTYPPRLHILLAREADYGLVIRRGPSRYVCTIGWDMARNKFTLGQWLKGRIYTGRCDLSPDGRHMIYFAMNGRWESEAKGSWTAISRTPYLKAIGLWPKGDCWHGGGLFVSSTRYWLNHPSWAPEPLWKPSRLSGAAECPFSENFGGECPGVYYPRLMRDGWKLSAHTDAIAVFEKPLQNHWILRKAAHSTVNHPPGKGCYYDEHGLVNTLTKESLKFPDWEWADTKKRKLYWAAQGRLYSGKTNESGVCSVRLLNDFNTMTFEAIRAPY